MSISHGDSGTPYHSMEAALPDLDDQSPYEVLLGSIDEVLGEWRDLVRAEPWSAIPPSRLVNSFPEILPRILRLARAGAMHIDEELKSCITDDHGLHRRADAVPLLAVAEEWGHLKRACGIVLRRRGIDAEGVTATLHRLEALIDDAVGYTLRGYYRPELDALRGRGLERRDSGVEDRRRGGGDRRRE